MSEHDTGRPDDGSAASDAPPPARRPYVKPVVKSIRLTQDAAESLT